MRSLYTTVPRGIELAIPCPTRQPSLPSPRSDTSYMGPSASCCIRTRLPSWQRLRAVSVSHMPPPHPDDLSRTVWSNDKSDTYVRALAAYCTVQAFQNDFGTTLSSTSAMLATLHLASPAPRLGRPGVAKYGVRPCIRLDALSMSSQTRQLRPRCPSSRHALCQQCSSVGTCSQAINGMAKYASPPCRSLRTSPSRSAPSPKLPVRG